MYVAPQDARDERIARLEAENALLRAEIAELKARLADVEERLGRTPRNSSMPPSQEGLSKPNRAQRRVEGRRQGKQPGAEGKHLAQVHDPDEVVVHAPCRCPGCGAGLSDAEVVDDEVRQVFDLPKIRPYVTEHHMVRVRCTCGCEVKAEAPVEASALACYGYGVRALACYLAVHFDETGGRVAGSLHWVHVACSPLYTLIECYKKRGTTAMDEMGVIATMRGVAVHDGWKPYRSYDVLHQLCNAHSAERAVMRTATGGGHRMARPPWDPRSFGPNRFCIIAPG